MKPLYTRFKEQNIKINKTFKIPEFGNDTFNLLQRGKNVTISCWISAHTFSKSLEPLTFDDNFKSSIEIPTPILVNAYCFFPDEASNMNDKRFFQINKDSSGKTHLYLYNRMNIPITIIKQTALIIEYVTDDA